MPTRNQIYLNAEKAPRLYVNSVQIAQSQFDLRLTMGTILEADDAKVVTDVSALVYMTIQHAKVLAEILNQQIVKYEKLNGPINQPTLPAADPNDGEA